MDSIIMLSATILLLFVATRDTEANISLGSCSLSCNENEDRAHGLIGSRGELQGPPGKRGPVGQKGERGVKGDNGVKGDVGVKGDSGIKGESGVKGNRGYKGDLGGTGHAGEKGNLGVKGQSGAKGDRGVKGGLGVKGKIGRKGIPGTACDCSRYNELATQMVALQEQVNTLEGRPRGVPDGWTKASNNLFYKFFNHERVDYETAKIRCASFGARLAAAGMRSTELRTEIMRLWPSPQSDTWIGLDRKENQGNFVWSDGIPATSSNTDWSPGEPDVNCCAVIGGSAHKMWDAYTGYNVNYLCEF